METTFKKSDSITNLAKAMMVFQEKVQAVPRNGKNPHFGSSFATLDDIVGAIKDPMKEAKLSYVQMPSGENTLVTVLMHETGEFMESIVKMNPKNNDPQGQGSAITYMRRYSLSAMLGLATEEDDDGNAATKPGKGNGEGKDIQLDEPKKNPLFEKAKKNLMAITIRKDLEDFKPKIEKSDKYTAEEKAELYKTIDETLAKLPPAKNAS